MVFFLTNPCNPCLKESTADVLGQSFPFFFLLRHFLKHFHHAFGNRAVLRFRSTTYSDGIGYSPIGK